MKRQSDAVTTVSSAFSRRGTVAAVILCAALVGGIAFAGDPILHEFFVVPAAERHTEGPLSAEDDDDSEAAVTEELSASLSDDASARDNPLFPPPLTIENRGDELEMGSDGAAKTPDGSLAPTPNGPSTAAAPAQPDRNTTLDQSLNYYSVFNPSVVPWKRVSSRDLVGVDYSLGVRNGRRKNVKVKDRPVRRDYERFWGSILVRMEKGQSVPLPTVAPVVQVLRVETEPPTGVVVERDGADNYFLSGDYDGTLRVNYLLEAPSTYFGGELDGDLEVGDLPRDLRPDVPRRVRKAAKRAVEAIGLDREAPFKEQLGLLVEYFRSFEAKDFPADAKSQDIYLDLTLNKLGVCRHRALAFVVTAQSVGLLARYVHNEAHAFVEVFVPRRGWLRIDLGGAAVDFEVHNARDNVAHTPNQPDMLPQPSSFTSSYSYRAGSGQPEADIDGDGKGGEPIEGMPRRPGQEGQLRAADDPQGADPSANGSDLQSDSPSGSGNEDDLEFPTSVEDPEVTHSTPRRPTHLSIVRAKRQVFRGESMNVVGTLTTDQGLPLSHKEVEAFLVPSGDQRPESFKSVGTGRTDRKGRVAIDVDVPQTLPLGRWSLYLYFRGTPILESSHSN